jgi:hypothetical protein
MFRSEQDVEHPVGNCYYYSDGDEEEDEDIVVYKEPVHDAVPVQYSQPQHFSQASSITTSTSKGVHLPLSQAQPVLPRVATKHFAMTRQERKRRRDEWKERCMLDNAICIAEQDQSYDSEEDNAEQDDEPLENAFASLQSLLEHQQEEEENRIGDDTSEHAHRDTEQCSGINDDKHEGKENDRNDTQGVRQHVVEKTRDTSLILMGTDAEQTQVARGMNHHERPPLQKQDQPANWTQEEIQPSPRDFVFFDDDDGVEGEEEQLDMTLVDYSTRIGPNRHKRGLSGTTMSRSSAADRNRRENRAKSKLHSIQPDESCNRTAANGEQSRHRERRRKYGKDEIHKTGDWRSTIKDRSSQSPLRKESIATKRGKKPSVVMTKSPIKADVAVENTHAMDAARYVQEPHVQMAANVANSCTSKLPQSCIPD